jgi:hypothetical protein
MKSFMADTGSQIVYVLTNPAMPGLVKIGKTTQVEVEERMKQLYGTGVPVPFDCARSLFFDSGDEKIAWFARRLPITTLTTLDVQRQDCERNL